jgi:transposase
VLPDALSLGDATSSDYHQFLRCLTPEAAEALTDHAHQLLVQRSIDEPVSWSPPRDWVNAQLPGVEIDDLDPATLIERVRSGDASSDIADDLGLSLSVVQALIHRHPPALHPRDRPNGSRPRILPEHATAEWLTGRRLAGATLRELASELAVNRKTLSRLLEEAGAPDVPRPARVAIKPDWLREQYERKGRTLPDIAAELGTTPTTIARHAREVGIRLRGRGGASHAAATRPTDHLSRPLRDALRGPNGQERLRRFQVVAHSRSINAAALVIGCEANVLLQQLAAIEDAVGHALVVRSTRQHQAQRLTATGRRLLHQAEEHLGVQPDSPRQHPEPLRSALDLYRGEYRVRRFVAAATAPTLAHAAFRLGSTPHTLARLITTLGERLEQPLLAAPARAPDQVRLTGAGKRLVEQARAAGLHIPTCPENLTGTPR